MTGMRKMFAWSLVYLLVAFATWRQVAIDPEGAGLIQWVTGFFFGANAVEHMGVKLTAGGPPK